MKALLIFGLLLGTTVGPVAAQQQGLGVVGTWTNCRLESSAGVIAANVCPILTFQPDGTGQATMEADTRESFTWQQAKNKLVVHNQATRSPILDSGSYTVSRRTARPADGALVLTNRLGLRYILFNDGNLLRP